MKLQMIGLSVQRMKVDILSSTPGLTWAGTISSTSRPMGCFKNGNDIYRNIATSSTQNCDSTYDASKKQAYVFKAVASMYHVLQ